VRFITNFSTGATGAALADFFRRAGHRVIYLHGLGAAKPQDPRDCIAFSDFKDLDRKLREQLRRRRFDSILHLAAVSDYSVASVVVGGRRHRPASLRKLDSGAEVQVELKRNFKMLDRLPGYAAGRPLIVGFKLTNTTDRSAIRRAVGRLACDLVVHNDLHDMKDDRTRSFRVLESGRLLAACSSRAELARKLCAIIQNRHMRANAFPEGSQCHRATALRRDHASRIGRGK
jgi:phosphopantothenoylcysteine decarboxylase/phosphopantothenate--cysteine ligase